MSPFRILASATAIELSFAAAAASIAGVAGMWSGWLDLINCFAPFMLAAALAGGALALAALGPGRTRTVTLAVAGAGALASLLTVAPEFANWRPAAKADGVTFRVLTVNGWINNPTPDAALAAILARNDDAVLVQETSGILQGPLQRGLRAAYPYTSACPSQDLEIWVKAPILGQSCGLGPGLTGSLASVTIAAPGQRSLTLATTHLSHPYPPTAQAAERVALAARMRALTAGDVILAGDFNATPWSFALKRLDSALAPLRRRTIGWFTWPARLDELELAWPLPFLPIDHLYASPDWSLVSLTRVRIPGADHFGAEAVLARKP